MTSPLADTLAEIGAAHDAGHIDQPAAISRIQAVWELTDTAADGILRDWQRTVAYLRGQGTPWTIGKPADTAKVG